MPHAVAVVTPPGTQSSRWCFTWNNPDGNAEHHLGAIECRYIVFGREQGESGTPHLQGFVVFRHAYRFNRVRELLPGCHLESARGTSKQAADYCKKDNDFVERGEPPFSQGKRTDLDEFVEWCKEQTSVPTRGELCRAFPNIMLKYPRSALDVAAAHVPAIAFTGHPREGWQSELEEMIEEEAPDDRSVHFYVDSEGNSGKSWMCKYLTGKYPDAAQMIRPSKADNMAYQIDESKWIFIVDCPRSQMEYLQYTVLEQMKDTMIGSGKYESTLKVLRKVPWVLVFCNENPDMTKLSVDRYVIKTI